MDAWLVAGAPTAMLLLGVLSRGGHQHGHAAAEQRFCGS